MSNSKITTREWVLTIAIIMLLQFIVLWGSSEFGHSKSALGYVSFAGTMVSIILAILAIVYSYFQSAGQQATSNNISNQVNKLINVVDDISDKEGILSNSLMDLELISKKIDMSIDYHKETQSEVLSLKDFVMASNTNSLVLIDGSKTENVLFEVDKISISFPSLIIYVAIKKDLNFVDIPSVLIRKVKGNDDNMFYILEGMVTSTLQLLISTSKIKLEDGKLFSTEFFDDYIKGVRAHMAVQDNSNLLKKMFNEVEALL